MPEKSLYERLGGVNAIAMVVDRFIDKIVKSPKLNVNPNLKEWNSKGQLEGLKFMRTLWICQAAGGPFSTPARTCMKRIRTCTSHPKSSTRSEPKLAMLSTISACRSAKKRELLAAVVAHKGEVANLSR